MSSRQQAEEIVRTVLLDAGCDFMAEDSVKFVAAKIDDKDATIARLEAENAGLRERAEGLARECQAWRECDIARANDDSGIEPSGLSEASYSLSRIMAKTDAAGWLRGATDGR